MSETSEEIARRFGANNLLIHAALHSVQRDLGTDILPTTREEGLHDSTYYPQFTEDVRREAAEMARHYEIFYCLEASIRVLVSERLREEKGAEWWTTSVPEVVMKNATGNRQRELKTGVTPRSDDMLAYTNFGELGEIIKANWDVFRDTFRDISAVESILARLNTLRAPIAHCSPLAEDEAVRLRLSLRDWFRQMGAAG